MIKKHNPPPIQSENLKATDWKSSAECVCDKTVGEIKYVNMIADKMRQGGSSLFEKMHLSANYINSTKYVPTDIDDDQLVLSQRFE